jgi:NADP-dependent 3-hydroxy acid dehydrogenase YdfG
MSNKNDIIWVTGGSSGIGKATVEELIANEYYVAASSRRVSALDELKNKFNDQLLIAPMDVSKSNEVIAAYQSIESQFKVNCLINNAGITSFSEASKNSFAESDEIINTNLLGAIYAIQAVLPGMIERNEGTIINILSVAAIKVFENSSVYAASKAGLLAYSKVLREELRDNNIRVINILPGATKTPIWPNDALEKFSGRMMNPADIAKLIVDILNIKGNMVPEEVVLRPTKGDL